MTRLDAERVTPQVEAVLVFALSLVEAYALEIREGIRAGKVPAGFCQGSVFLEGGRQLRDVVERVRHG